jgi:hypothetical protein
MKQINSKTTIRAVAMPKDVYRLCVAAAKLESRTFTAWARIQLEKAVKAK